jgi:hypothetical protein
MAALLTALLLSSLAATPLQAPVADIDAPLQGAIPAPGDAAVVIGNEDYRTLPDVPFAGRDARAVEGFLRYTRGIAADRIAFVADGTRDEMLRALARGSAKVGKGGTLWVYFVGHGAVDRAVNDRLLVAVDAADTPKALTQWSVSLGEVLAACQAPGHRTLVILDAGFQGVGRDGREVFARWRYDAPPIAAYLPQDLMIWTAVAPDQDERTFEGAQHGLFTYFLVGALRGWADGANRRTPDGMVTLEEAHTWVGQAMGAFGVRPTLERGGSADLWDLSRGAMESAPGAGAVPAPRQTAPIHARSDPSTTAALARMDEIRANAKRDWARVAKDAARGGERARSALERFLATYGDQTVVIDGRTVVVTVEEVETARTLYARLQGPSPLHEDSD